MESAGEARHDIWIATTECWVRRAACHHCCRVSTSTTPHTFSCTNQHLSRVTTREEGSALCSFGIRLTSRVVPPYTSYTGHTVAAAAAW